MHVSFLQQLRSYHATLKGIPFFPPIFFWSAFNGEGEKRREEKIRGKNSAVSTVHVLYTFMIRLQLPCLFGWLVPFYVGSILFFFPSIIMHLVKTHGEALTRPQTKVNWNFFLHVMWVLLKKLDSSYPASAEGKM